MKIRTTFGDKNDIGPHIRELRIEKGMYQQDLLIALQLQGLTLTAATLSKIQGRFRPVNDREIKALTKALGVTPNDILGIE